VLAAGPGAAGAGAAAAGDPELDAGRVGAGVMTRTSGRAVSWTGAGAAAGAGAEVTGAVSGGTSSVGVTGFRRTTTTTGGGGVEFGVGIAA